MRPIRLIYQIIIRLIRLISPIRLIENFLYRLIPPFRRLRPLFRRLIAITLTLSLTLTSFYSLSFLLIPKASAAWFDDSWGYRQRVDITNTGSAQTDYQVSITLDTATLITAGKLQSDCDDLRITDTNGKLLPHWIEESNPGCNSATTKIWTKAPSITTSGATVYLYYGNPSATNVENPTQVFVFYDNFSGDLSRWTIPSGCTSAISSGVLQITANTTCDSTPMYVTNLTQSDASGYAFDFRGKFSSGGTRLQMYQRYRSTNSYLSRFWTSGTVTNFQENAGSWSSNIDIGSTGTSADTWYNFGVKVTGTSNQLYVNGTSIGTGTTLPAGLTTQTDLTVGLGQYGTTVQYDNVRVRKSASTEPSIASPTNEEKATSPVAYWKFDDGTGTNAQDSSQNNNDATLAASTATPTWQTEDQCISGKCLRFDGTDDYASATYISAITKAGISSFSAWIKPTTVTGTFTIFENSASTSDRNAMNITNGVLAFGYYNGTSWSGASGTVAANTWYHVVGVNSSGTLSLYINGVLQTGTANPYGYANSTFNIGKTSLPGQDNFFKGQIDEVKIYNFALTAAQVKSNYNAKASGDGASAVLGSPSTGSGQLASGLVGYWKMDEAAANGCTGGVNDNCDSSGNGIDGAWNGDATSAVGKFGNSVTLDGTGDYVSAATISVSSVTAAAWVYSTNFASNMFVLYKAPVNAEWELFFETNLLWRGGSTTSISCTAPSNSAWHHIVGTQTGTTATLYIDGAQCATGTVTALPNGSGVINIGSFAGSYPFNGKIDEARVYNRALSPDEVSQLYNFAPGPVGYWNFEEGSGSSTVDKANGLSGVITGATFQPGKYGKGLKFDGTDDVVTVTDPGANSVLDMNGQITMNAWFKTSSTNDYSGLMVKSDSATHGYQINMQTNGNTGGYLYSGAAASGNIDTSANYEDGNWHYISMSYDGTSSKVYVDGVLKTTTTPSGYLGSASNDNSNLLIGNDSCCGSRFFNGTLDEVKIYNYARNSKQVVSDMNAGHPAPGSPVGSAVGHWRFDEGADNTCSGGVKDACNSGNGGNSLDATATGLAVPATATSGWSQAGKFGKGMLFDGTGDYLEVADSTAIRMGTSDWTLSAWIKSSQSSGNYQILDKRNAGPTVRYQMYLGDGKLVTELRSTSAPDVSASVTGATTISDGNWHYVAATFTRSANLVIYVDGRSDGSVSISSMNGVDINGTSTLVIGAVALNFSLPFNGAIDEVKIYNFALTASEVKLDMNRGQAQLLGATSDNSSYQKQAANQEYCVPGDSTSCVAPIARWDFNEGGSSTTTADTSGSGNTGTITVGASGSQTTASQLWKPGKAGKALNLDGTDDYVTLGSALNVANTMTITGWFFTNDITKRQTLLALHSGGANTGNIEVGAPFGVASGAVGMVQYGVATTANTPAGLYSNGTWVHFAYTRNGAYTTQQFYINGVAVTTTQANFTLSDDAGVGQIGVRTSGSQFFTGSVDNLRVYNYARTGAQIAWDYNRGGPVGHWRFDECQGLTANDSSGNSNSGTITIGATGTYTSAGTCPSGTATHAWAGGVAGAGKRNYALSFDGTDDYVSVASPTKIPSGAAAFTSSVWIKPSSAADNKYIMMWGVSGVSGTMNALIWYGATSSVAQAFYGNDLQTATNSVPVSAWTHLVATYDGTTRKIYLNGALSTSDTPTAPNVTANQTLYIGSVGGSAYFPGQIDDARVYSYALTATQVKMLYTGFTTFYGPSTGAP